MRVLDFSPLSGSWIGFEPIFDLLQDSMLPESREDNYPPFNVERTGEDDYRVSLALAGFEPEDVSIEAYPDRLVIRGSKPKGDSYQYLYRGIAARPFERQFALADHVHVKEAHMTNGLLTIGLVRELPESMKPRRIAITQGGRMPGGGPRQIEGSAVA